MLQLLQQLTRKKRNWFLSTFIPALLLSVCIPQKTMGQSALSQLESWAGRSVGSVNVPSPSSPSGIFNYKVPFQKTQAQLAGEAKDHYQNATKAFYSRNWDEAIRLLKKASRKDPYNQTYKNKLTEAENALYEERQKNKVYQEALKQQKEEQRTRDEAIQRKEIERLEKERKEQEAVRKKINEAKKTIESFKKDIRNAQGHLKNYSKALANNNSELEKWAKEVDDMNNKVLDESKSYLISMFIKYNMLQGILKRSYTETLYKRTGNLCKSANPAIQKWFVKELKSIDVRIDEVQDVVDRVSLGGDMAELLNGDIEQAGRNLKILMFLNGVFETAHFSDYDNLIKQVEKPFGLTNMPGEYFEQAKMIGIVIASFESTAFSWFQIRKLNISNEEMAQKVTIYSAVMEQRMNEIDCLEKCIKKYTNRCLEDCTEKTKWSTPPPLLLF